MGTRTMIDLAKRVALTLTALVGLALAAPAVSAQEQELAPEHLALARKYVELTDKSNIYEVALVETAVATMRSITATNPEIVGPVNDAITKSLEDYKGKKGDLLDQFARVYALSFGIEELQQIVAFYESPVGTKLAAANATLNESLQMVMQVFQANLRTEFVAKVRAELKAGGFTP